MQTIKFNLNSKVITLLLCCFAVLISGGLVDLQSVHADSDKNANLSRNNDLVVRRAQKIPLFTIDSWEYFKTGGGNLITADSLSATQNFCPKAVAWAEIEIQNTFRDFNENKLSDSGYLSTYALDYYSVQVQQLSAFIMSQPDAVQAKRNCSGPNESTECFGRALDVDYYCKELIYEATPYRVSENGSETRSGLIFNITKQLFAVSSPQLTVSCVPRNLAEQIIYADVARCKEQPTDGCRSAHFLEQAKNAQTTNILTYNSEVTCGVKHNNKSQPRRYRDNNDNNPGG